MNTEILDVPEPMEAMDPRPAAAVLGGDTRQAYAARALMAAGFDVRLFKVDQAREIVNAEPCKHLPEAVTGAKLVVCPVSCQGLDIALLLDTLEEEQTIIGINLPQELKNGCAMRDIPFHDLLDREDFTLLNAIPSAEGAIAEAIAASVCSLHLNEALVLGYGRCGRVLAQKLGGLGAHVTVAARRWESACEAIASGCEALDFLLLPYHMGRFYYVFNTIPAMALDEKLLQALPPEAVVIDIASGPGGVDFEAAEELGVTAKLCPGLPGIYSPRSAGEAVAQISRIILEEQEESPWGWNKCASASD